MSVSRSLVAAVMLGAFAVLGFGRAVPRARAGTRGHWVAAWYSPPVPQPALPRCHQVVTFNHQSVREVVRLEAGGDRLRIRLTNELGLQPLRFGEVRVALSSPNGVTESGTDRIVTFAGERGATIPRGKALLSDPVDLEVRRFQNLAISVYYQGPAAPAGHMRELEISPSGNHTAEAVWPQGGRSQAPALASGVEVESASPRNVLVAFGDSITAGFCATRGAHLDYPHQLADLLAGRPGGDRSWVVINSGISGNRLLRDGAGPKALARFKRDALDIPGVRAILLLEGINDIGRAFDRGGGSAPLTAHDIIAAYRTLIHQAHARGLKVFLGTLTPYMGATYSRPQGERVREDVNEWIRKGQGFDGVVDYDAALRDPASPLHFRGADQCGDDLHPNDAGYHAMAELALKRLFGSRVGRAPLARVSSARSSGAG